MMKILFSSVLFFFITFSAFASSTSKNEIQLQQRISLLESAMMPTSPEATVALWAKAAKERNGAVQYMLMCPDIQQQNKKALMALNWVTGISSPSISEYKIIPENKNNQTKNFIIQYQFSIGSRKFGEGVDHMSIIHVNNSSQQWCINAFQFLSPIDSLQKNF